MIANSTYVEARQTPNGVRAMGALRYLTWLAALWLLPSAMPTYAQSIAIQSITALNLGNVASAPANNTVFTVTPSTGAVAVSGGGGRISTGLVRATVTIRCTGSAAQCNGATINVRVGTTGSPSGRAAAMTNLTAASGTATLVSAPAAGNPISFQISPIPRNTNRTFYVGGEFNIVGDSGAGTWGTSNAPINVRVAVAPTTPATPGTDSSSTAFVVRSMSVAKVSDLNFGSIVRPTTTNGTVTYNAQTGAISRTGNAVIAATPRSRAEFTITGEGGRVVSPSFGASTFTLTRSGGSETLTVTLSRFPTGTLTLSGAAGGSGTGTLYVGGSFPIATTTVRGAYAGSFNVIFNYN